jgi:hypothetical protein
VISQCAGGSKQPSERSLRKPAEFRADIQGSNVQLAPVSGLLHRIWAAALVVPLGAFAFVGSFSRYASDDFCTASVAVNQGFLATQWYWYTTWSGRYTFTLLDTALELIGTWTPQVLPTLATVAWVAAGTWALLPGARHQRWPSPLFTSFMVAELVSFASLTAAPNVGQSFYWQTGLLTYTLPLILATLFAGWVLRQLVRADGHVSKWSMAASGVACFAIGGLSESSLMIQAVALILVLALGYAMLRGPRRTALLGLLGPALLGSIFAGGVMLLAPGTHMRAAQEDDPQVSLARAVVAARASLSLAVWIVRRFEVLSRPTVVLILVICGQLGFVAWRRLSSPRGTEWRRLAAQIALVALVGFGLEPLSLFPVYLVQGFDPPGRVQELADFVLVVALCACAY